MLVSVDGALLNIAHRRETTVYILFEWVYRFESNYCTNLISAVDCGTPPPLSNAILNYQSTLFESVVTYTCEVGYIAIGINNITCMENAKWSYLTVRCESK